MATPMKPKTRSIFAQRLSQARHAKGWSQREFARLLNTDCMRVADWETDRNRPRIDKLSAMAKLLGVRAGWLLGME